MAEQRVCVLCGGACTGNGCLKDSRQRYFHRRCYEEALQRQKAARAGEQRPPSPGPGSTTPRQAAASPVAGPPVPTNRGSVLCCTSSVCGRKFHAKGKLPSAQSPRLACPACGSPLTIQPKANSAAPVLMAILVKEEPPPEIRSQDRLAQLFRLEDSGQPLNRSLQNEKNSLICRCLKERPTSCPGCSSTIRTGDKLCIGCGLQFAGGRRLSSAVRSGKDKYAESIMKRAEARIEEEDKRAREDAASEGDDKAAAVGIALDVLSLFLGG